MKRFIAIITVLLLIAGVFAGCGGNSGVSSGKTLTSEIKDNGAEQNQESSSKDNTSESSYPLNVKDATGYEMTIEKEPVRIASMTLGTDEILLGDKTLPGLVDKSRIIALGSYSDDPGISNIAEASKQISNKISKEDIEKIIELQPDLLFADTWLDSKIVKQLRDAKINVYIFETPKNINEIKATIMEIANIIGSVEEGKKITAWIDEKLKAVEDKLKALKETERLTVMDYSEMGTTSGKGTNFDDAVTRAGLVNVVAKAGMEKWPKLSKEMIVDMNPDIIILPSWYYDKKNSLDGLINTLKNDKSLSCVKAVKNSRFLAIPNPHLCAISQYSVLGVEDTAKAAYPELFK